MMTYLLASWIIGGLIGTSVAATTSAVTTKVHIIEINPNAFNWSIAAKRDFHYRVSLVGLPDLPKWLSYKYSSRHEAGFLYGVPPSPSPTQIEVIALNRDMYETKRKIIHINVTEKPDPAKRRVEMKIDNLNVEDLFDQRKVNELKKVLTRILWPESSKDLYLTLLTSALTMGGRRPLSPDDGEGVVLHLGSRAEFSSKLLELQEEVAPLWKLGSCPRDYRRASVDRHFRQAGFHLDWCSFRLSHIVGGDVVSDTPGWSDMQLVERISLPVREYSTDLLTTLVSPIAVLLVLILILSFILCFHHDALRDESSDLLFNSLFLICEKYFRNGETADEPESKLVQYEAVHRATSTLRSMSNNRETTSQSTNNTLKSVQQIEEDVSRPSPPPYGATRRLLHTMDS